MVIGVLTVEAALYEARSLKDKRRVIKGVKDRLRNRLNVSVAEVEFADAARRSRIAVAVVSSDTRFVHSVLDQAVDTIRNAVGLTLLDYDREIL